MELNFNKVMKHYLKIVLTDEEQTTVMVGTPNKKLLDKIMAMDKTLKKENIADANTISSELVDELYNICGEIMSINKTNTKITSEKLGGLLDVEDIYLFFNTYMTFLDSIANSKN